MYIGQQQQPQINIVYGSEPTDAAILSNGEIISYSAFKLRNEVVKKGYLQATDNATLFYIIDSGTNKAVAMFNSSGKGCILSLPANGMAQQQQSNNLMQSTGGISIGLQQPNTGVISGAMHTGAVAIGAGQQQQQQSVVITPNAAPTPPPTDIAATRQPLEGYEFYPIPTSYNKIETQDVGQFYKYKILINEGKDMNDNPHSKVYDSLESEANKPQLTTIGSVDDFIDLDNPTSSLSLDIMLVETKNKYNVISGFNIAAVLTSISAKTSAIVDESALGVSATADGILVNDYIRAIGNSTNISELIKAVTDKYQEHNLLTLLPYFTRIFYEELVVIDGPIKITRTFNPFKHAIALSDVVETKITDLELKRRYKKALDKIFSRLSFDGSKYFDSVRIENKIVTAGLLGSSKLIAVARDALIEKELEILISGGTEEDDVYKIADNTPNTLKLINSLFNGSVKLSNNGIYNINDYGDVNHTLVLCIKNRMFTVVESSKNNYVIFKYL